MISFFLASGAHLGSREVKVYVIEILMITGFSQNEVKDLGSEANLTLQRFGSILLMCHVGADLAMRVISRKTLRSFWERHPLAQNPLLAWYREAELGDWESPAQIRSTYRSASIVGDNRVVFNLKGNDYRLVVKINYPYRVVYIRFVGTHAEYDRINVEEV